MFGSLTLLSCRALHRYRKAADLILSEGRKAADLILSEGPKMLSVGFEIVH